MVRIPSSCRNWSISWFHLSSTLRWLNAAEQRVARRNEAGQSGQRVHVGPDHVTEDRRAVVVLAEGQIQVPGVRGPALGAEGVPVHEVVLDDVVVVVNDRLHGQVVDRRRDVQVVVQVSRCHRADGQIDSVDQIGQLGIVVVRRVELFVDIVQLVGVGRSEIAAVRLVTGCGRIQSVAHDPVGIRSFQKHVQAEKLTVALESCVERLIVRRSAIAKALPGQDLPHEGLVYIAALQIEIVDLTLEQPGSLEVVSLWREELPVLLLPGACRLAPHPRLHRVVQRPVEIEHRRLRLVGEQVAQRLVVDRLLDSPPRRCTSGRSAAPRPAPDPRRWSRRRSSCRRRAGNASPRSLPWPRSASAPGCPSAAPRSRVV